MRIHWLDALFARMVLSREPRYFEDGWGAPALLEELLQPPRVRALPEPCEVLLQPARREQRMLVQEGRFISPAATGALPATCHEARIQLLLPSDAGPHPPVCLLLAGSGDQGFGLRRSLVSTALARHGVGTLLLENPYYGARRPPGQHGVAVRTVADLLLMFRSTALESIALLSWLLSRGHPKVGISGYSMGGSLAAYVAALFPLPLAVVPVAAAHAVAPIFQEGVLSELADWKALGRTSEGPEDARRRLVAALDGASITALPPLANPRRAILLGAREDGFVPPSSTLRLAQHWQGAELRSLSGGHVSALFTGRHAVVRAILDAFARL